MTVSLGFENESRFHYIKAVIEHVLNDEPVNAYKIIARNYACFLGMGALFDPGNFNHYATALQ